MTIPDSVTKIGGSAFWECASLTSVTIPDGVTEIESSAFYGCKNLTSVTISDSVTKIGEWAFHGCENLTSVTIPDSVTEIGDDAFSRCGKLNVRLSGSPTLGKDAFDGVFGIIAPQTSVSEFSDTEAKKVATRAFLSNIPLYTDFVIAEDYKKYAISKRKKLLPDILKEDNAEALAFYAANKKITVKNFDEEYFIPAEEHKAQNCIAYLLDWKNKNITAEDIEKEIEKEFTKDPYNAADMKKLWYYEVMEDGSICITGYKGKDAEVYVPERIGKNTVTRIGDNAFSPVSASGKQKPKATREALQKITAVYIPDSVTEIGSSVFARCKNLTSVNIPDSVTEIGGGAFIECKNLTSVTIPDSVTKIGGSAFDGCESLTSVTIPDGVTEIGSSVFERCKNLTSVNIPDSVTEIGGYAFDGCKSLTSVTIPDSVTEIGYRAFDGCESLMSMTIPDSVTKIEDFAFSGCENLTIHAPASSYAEQHAKENNIPFVAEG